MESSNLGINQKNQSRLTVSLNGRVVDLEGKKAKKARQAKNKNNNFTAKFRKKLLDKSRIYPSVLVPNAIDDERQTQAIQRKSF